MSIKKAINMAKIDSIGPTARIICKGLTAQFNPHNKGSIISGLMVDVGFISEALHEAGWGVIFSDLLRDVPHDKYTGLTHDKPMNLPQINIFIEHVGRQDWATAYPCLHNKNGRPYSFILLNQEWLTDWDLDAIKLGVIPLFKTHYAEAIFNKYLKIKGFYTGGSYLAHTVNIDDVHDKIRGMALHMAGSSPLKGTFGLLRALIAAHNLGRNSPVKLVSIKGTRQSVTDSARKSVNNFAMIVIIRDTFGQFRPLLHWWDSLHPVRSKLPAFILDKTDGRYDDLWFSNIGPVYLYHGYINDINYLLAKSWLSVCPSMTEGFGHYINEARLSRTNVLTLDAPPMNELITHPSQLIRAKSAGTIFDVLPGNWTKSIQRVYPVEVWEAADPAEFAARIKYMAITKLDKVVAQVIEDNARRAIGEARNFNERLASLLKKLVGVAE